MLIGGLIWLACAVPAYFFGRRVTVLSRKGSSGPAWTKGDRTELLFLCTVGGPAMLIGAALLWLCMFAGDEPASW